MGILSLSAVYRVVHRVNVLRNTMHAVACGRCRATAKRRESEVKAIDMAHAAARTTALSYSVLSHGAAPIISAHGQ